MLGSPVFTILALLAIECYHSLASKNWLGYGIP